MILIGPFAQIVTMNHLPERGSIKDEQLEVLSDAGIVIEGETIEAVGSYRQLKLKYSEADEILIKEPRVLVPGFVDSHTHLCFAGNRARDYAMRLAGKSYLEIARKGGGIQDTVHLTRQATKQELAQWTVQRADRHLRQGVTTIEVKSGYGLNTEEELKILRAIREAGKETQADLVATCLAAHLKPKDFQGDETDYLKQIVTQLFPKIKQEQLANRIDIFIEETAFSKKAGSAYLKKAGEAGFECTVHADQFSCGGSEAAVDCGAISADHLEASGEKEIQLLARSQTIATALPGASIGLGMQFAPARRLLDAGCCLAIASDWNPGSAPMGDLLTEAALLGVYEKLTPAECLAGLTCRAAKALNLKDRGMLKKGMLADLQAYPTNDFRDIFYQQGALKTDTVWKRGTTIKA